MGLSGKMKLASNPWDVNLSPLPSFVSSSPPSPELLSGTQIIYNISKILDDWPGTSTPILSKKERHNRLVKTIAGYPDIDVATRPLDWTLHPLSINALSTSLAIDNLVGVNPNTSLRSEILNLDYNHRTTSDNNSENQEWDELSCRCLALLFNKSGADNQSREALLASLFSYDNVDGISGNWKRTLEKTSEIPIFSLPLPKPSEPTSTEKKEYYMAKKQNQLESLDPQLAARCKRWDQYSSSLKAQRGIEDYCINNEDYLVVTFQFHRIQSWLLSLLKNDKSKATSQRVLRGASLFLESIISALRDVAINQYGPGSIIVDGGGRLSVSVPTQKQALKLEGLLRKEYESFLIVEHTTQTRLSRELECWFKSLEIPQKGTGEEKRKVIREFALCGLPPRSFNISSKQYTNDKNETRKEISSEDDLIMALNEWGQPPELFSIDEKYLECPFLNEDLSNEIINWNSVDDWVFKPVSKVKEKYGIIVNNNHRLLYIAGHFQRMKDSILHKPKNESPHDYIETPSGLDRSVIGVLKLDGNSIGHLFSQDKNHDFSLDVTRRRSFRFNAHWWGSLFNAIELIERNGGDYIGGWVVAGDDLLLGEYGPRGNKPTRLVQMMNNFSKNLSQSINLELDVNGADNNPILTFAAGFCIRQEGDTLSKMINKVNVAEEMAGTIWKKIAYGNNDWLLLSDKKRKDLESDGSTLNVDITPAKMIEEGHKMDLYVLDSDIVSCIEQEEVKHLPRSIVINWPNSENPQNEVWNKQLLDVVMKKIHETLEKELSYQDLFKIITRSERVIPLEESNTSTKVSKIKLKIIINGEP